MKQRFLSVVMLLVTALTAGAYNIWIAGTQVTDANIDKLSEIEGVTGTITFDSSTFTLTLTDATITGAGSMEGALRCMYPSAMTVVVNGTCVINGGDNYGIYSTCGTSASTGLTAYNSMLWADLIIFTNCMENQQTGVILAISPI